MNGRESYPLNEVNKALTFCSRGYFAQYDRMQEARAFLLGEDYEGQEESEIGLWAWRQ